MKKIYFAPSMKTVRIKSRRLMAGSLPMSSTKTIKSSGEVLAPELSDEGDDYDF